MLYLKGGRSMDEVKIESKPTRKFVSALVKMFVRKKFGYDVIVDLGGFRTTIIDEKVHIHLDVDLDMSPEEFKKLNTNP